MSFLIVSSKIKKILKYISEEEKVCNDDILLKALEDYIKNNSNINIGGDALKYLIKYGERVYTVEEIKKSNSL